jgi:hypothetical protein
LEKEDAINSPAITTSGKLVVGIGGTTDISYITPEQYIQARNSGNKEGYQLLTNGQLLEFRKNHPSMAFSDSLITDIAYNGTSI